MSTQKEQKFEKIFSSTKKKMGENKTIDFKESGVNELISNKNKKDTTGKKKRHAVYLSESENKAFLDTFKPRETASERIRNLILEDIVSRRNK